MRRLYRWWRDILCRHMDVEIDFEVDGPAPGWSWHCFTCGKTRSLEK